MFLLFHALKKRILDELLIVGNYFNMKLTKVMNSLMVADKAKKKTNLTRPFFSLPLQEFLT